MNQFKIGISIILAIIAIITISSFQYYQLIENELTDEEWRKQINQKYDNQTVTPEIEKLLDIVKDTKIQNEQSEEPFIPRTPEWTNASGPFLIDNDEYWLGQKVFVNISGLDEKDKGRVNVYVPVVNEDYMLRYSSIAFDGSIGRNNYYFTPGLSESLGICSTDQLIGKWVMRFEGTQYPDITFTVVDKIIPGYELMFETIPTGNGFC